MPEELLEFENTVGDPEGRSHVARGLGEERDEGALARARKKGRAEGSRGTAGTTRSGGER